MSILPRGRYLALFLLAGPACGARTANEPPPAMGDGNANANAKPAEAQAGKLRVPTAAVRELVVYLSGVHKKIHPLFADEFLAQLSKLPPNDPTHDPQLDTVFFLAISADGHLARLDIGHPSGAPAFDAGGKSAITRAQPFAITPIATRSFDGNTYLRWDFHRDDVRACSLLNIVPFRFVDDGELQFFLRHVAQMTPLKPMPAQGRPGAPMPHGADQVPEVMPAPGDVQL